LNSIDGGGTAFPGFALAPDARASTLVVELSRFRASVAVVIGGGITAADACFIALRFTSRDVPLSRPSCESVVYTVAAHRSLHPGALRALSVADARS
jgi:hypothetical protein